MVVKKKKKTVDRWKKKKWYNIVAPKCFEEKVIGHTISSEPSQILGRVVKTTLKEITGNMPHQSMGLKFRVVDVKGESAHTIATGHEIQRGYIMRQFKRMRSLINAIFPVVTKDGQKVQITAVAFGKGKMSVKQEAAIRKVIQDQLTEKAAKADYDKFFQEMIFGKFSSEVFKAVKKIYPITRMEIRKSRLIEGQGLPVSKEEKKEEKEEKPKKVVAKKKEEKPKKEKVEKKEKPKKTVKKKEKKEE